MLYTYKDLLSLDLFSRLQDDMRYWEYNNFSNNKDVTFWGAGDQDRSLLIFREAQTIVKLKIQKDIPYRINSERIWLNCSTPNTQGSMFHTDFPHDNFMTFVLYTSPKWDVQWGGETVVYDSNGEYHYVPYIPNSGCMFPSNWEHYGASPNAHSKSIRTSMAFTYEVCYNKPIAR